MVFALKKYLCLKPKASFKHFQQKAIIFSQIIIALNFLIFLSKKAQRQIKKLI